jgi:cytochrome P450
MTVLASFTRVTSFGEAAELLVSKKFHQCGHADEAEAPVTADSLISLHGGAHFSRRRIENPLFSREMLAHYESAVLLPALRERIDDARREHKGDGPVRADLLRLARGAMLQVTAALIGLDDVGNTVSVDELTGFAEAFAPAAALIYKDGSTEEAKAAALASLAKFRERLYEPAVAARRPLVESYGAGELPADELPRDLLTMLLAHLPDLPDDMLLREVTLFIVASTDTTTHGVATTLAHLFEWFDAHPEDRALSGDVMFLRDAAFEAIRLHPPPAVLREAAEDVALPSGRIFARGERVLVDLTAVNRDPIVFGPDADQFDPRRVLPPRMHRYALGFGGGAHTCIGRGMATASGIASGESDDDAVGTVVRVIRELLAAGVQLDPSDPPHLRPGWTQERFERFTVILPR